MSVRTGVVGLGMMGRHHVRMLRTHAAVVATPADDHLPVRLQPAAAGGHAAIEKTSVEDVAAGRQPSEVRNVNGAMPPHLVHRLETALGDLVGVRVAALGLAYRQGVKVDGRRLWDPEQWAPARLRVVGVGA